MKEFLKKVWAWIKAAFKKVYAWVVSTPKDKLQHDYAGALIALYTFVLLFLFLPYWPSFIAANSVSFITLVAKEAYDAAHPDTHSAECQDASYWLFGVLKVDIALLILLIAL